VAAEEAVIADEDEAEVAVVLAEEHVPHLHPPPIVFIRSHSRI